MDYKNKVSHLFLKYRFTKLTLYPQLEPIRMKMLLVFVLNRAFEKKMYLIKYYKKFLNSIRFYVLIASNLKHEPQFLF